ncbi:hypothetical protein FGADI_5780 [Fusarium gaditjirri]|uniref:Uncharacterized protein n=1 Tax=Fusarium gaditjirri TaxID=282569 RepID=A0A8H4T9W7_9HYPO|nr:hypothetical protein FGADI_5780 [Fusarium gaditjirri]
MSDQSLPFRNTGLMSGLRREYKQRVANLSEDVAQAYELRVKVDRANREFKEGFGRNIDELLLHHSDIIKNSDAVKTGDSLLLTEGDIAALYNKLGNKVIPEQWYEYVLEIIRKNEKLKAQEKATREKHYELYHQEGRPHMTRDNGSYTRRMDWYAKRLFRPQDTTEDGPLPVKIVKRLEFLKDGEADISESDFELDLSARTYVPIDALRPGVESKDPSLCLWIERMYGYEDLRDS